MKRALIEIATKRFAQVVPVGFDFPVAPGLVWIDCADNVAPETHLYDGANFVLKPSAPLAPDLSDINNLDKALKANARLTQQYANALLAGTFVAKSVADVRADFMAIYRSLP